MNSRSVRKRTGRPSTGCRIQAPANAFSESLAMPLTENHNGVPLTGPGNNRSTQASTSSHHHVSFGVDSRAHRRTASGSQNGEGTARDP